MTSRPAPNKLMIVDACVLIDFIKAERTVLELVAKHIGPLHVISLVVDEVREIDDENELVELGFVIIEPMIADALAVAGESGPLSLQDKLCLLEAKRHGFTCVTNDKRLRKECKQGGVPVLWGLELLIELHKTGVISGNEAERIERSIRKENPYSSEQISSSFKEKIRRQERERPKSC